MNKVIPDRDGGLTGEDLIYNHHATGTLSMSTTGIDNRILNSSKTYSITSETDAPPLGGIITGNLAAAADDYLTATKETKPELALAEQLNALAAVKPSLGSLATRFKDLRDGMESIKNTDVEDIGRPVFRGKELQLFTLKTLVNETRNALNQLDLPESEDSKARVQLAALNRAAQNAGLNQAIAEASRDKGRHV